MKQVVIVIHASRAPFQTGNQDATTSHAIEP